MIERYVVLQWVVNLSNLMYATCNTEENVQRYFARSDILRAFGVPISFFSSPKNDPRKRELVYRNNIYALVSDFPPLRIDTSWEFQLDYSAVEINERAARRLSYTGARLHAWPGAWFRALLARRSLPLSRCAKHHSVPDSQRTLRLRFIWHVVWFFFLSFFPGLFAAFEKTVYPPSCCPSRSTKTRSIISGCFLLLLSPPPLFLSSRDSRDISTIFERDFWDSAASLAIRFTRKAREPRINPKT